MTQPYAAQTDAPTGPPRAIGYLRHDTFDRAGETAIRSLAKRRGFHLVRVVKIAGDPNEALDQLLDIVRGYNAAVVIVPSLHHVGGNAAPIWQICDLMTADDETTYMRTQIAPHDNSGENE